jgi:hypothetical protein
MKKEKKLLMKKNKNFYICTARKKSSIDKNGEVASRCSSGLERPDQNREGRRFKPR